MEAIDSHPHHEVVATRSGRPSPSRSALAMKPTRGEEMPGEPAEASSVASYAFVEARQTTTCVSRIANAKSIFESKSPSIAVAPLTTLPGAGRPVCVLSAEPEKSAANRVLL